MSINLAITFYPLSLLVQVLEMYQDPYAHLKAFFHKRKVWGGTESVVLHVALLTDGNQWIKPS